MKPEDRNNLNDLRLAGFDRPDKDDYSPLTKAEQLELAVDLDNLEEKLRFAPDGDADREMLQRWVDRLCK